MRPLWRWGLWVLLSAAIVGAFLPATRPGEGFVGESGRILYFHVPNAWASFVAFIAAGVWSLRYLFGKRALRHDRAAAAAVELGLVFCVLATVTGAIWARVQWGAYWNWDPRQISITMALLFYAAYMALRGAVAEPDARARFSAAFAALGLIVAPFLFFVLPRITFSLHPQPVVNASGTIDMARPMLIALLVGAASFTGLFFWLHHLRCELED